jgi:hypothetical protein
MITLKYVDLGTMRGRALDDARSLAKELGLPAAKPHECLGVDNNHRHKQCVLEKGYHFELIDLPAPKWSWPAADCYLAFDFLEHLPSLKAVRQVLHRMFKHARLCVWLGLPSFEDGLLDPLAEIGYCVPWVKHPRHLTLVKKHHCYEVANQYDVRQVEEQPRHLIADTRDEKKPLTILPGRSGVPKVFDPPLVGYWWLRYWLPG